MQFDGRLRLCQPVDESGGTQAKVSALVGAVRGARVLTISDVDNFSQNGGIAQMSSRTARSASGPRFQ